MPARSVRRRIGGSVGRGVARRMAGQVIARGGRAVVRGVSKASPYIGAAMTAYDGARAIQRRVGGGGPSGPAKKKRKVSAPKTEAHNVVESKELELVYKDHQQGSIKGHCTAYTTKEVNHILSDPKAVYCGSSTFIPNQVCDDVMAALARYVAKRLGVDVFNIMDLTDRFIDAQWQVTVSEGPATPSTVGVTQVTPTETWYDFGQRLKGSILALGILDKMWSFQKLLVKVQYNNVLVTDYVNYVEINFNKAHVTFRNVCQLNVQNVTTNEGGGNSTDVSVINPLEMTVYSGKGMGGKFVVRSGNTLKAACAFAGDYYHGHISVIATDYTASAAAVPQADDWNTLAEPPSGVLFRGTKKVCKKIIMPGGIARTEQSSFTKMNFDRFIQVIRNAGYSNSNTVGGLNPIPNSLISVGKHCFIGFEKIINSIGSSDNVKVKMEVNNKLSAEFSPGKMLPNAPKYFQTLIPDHDPILP